MNHGRSKMLDVDVEVASINLCWAGRDERSWEPWLLFLFVVHIVGDVIDGLLRDDARRVDGDLVWRSFCRAIDCDDRCLDERFIVEPC